MKKPTAPAGQSGPPAKPASTAKPGSAAKPTAKPRPAAGAAPAEPAPAPPRSVVIAVRLMYVGAVVTAIGLVISVIAVATDLRGLRASHPHATLAHLHGYQNALITIAIISGLVEIALWLIMARANRAGARWARMAASVLFAFGSWNFASHFLGKITIGNIAYSAVTWLVGLAVIVFLWQRPSSEYLAAMAASGPVSSRRRS
jgi:hypothetical protein